MKTPEALEPLIDYGIVQEVIRPLMSGKEAQVYVVLAGGEECVAKVYKEAIQRTFKHRAEYTEGRRTRSSRDQRAVSKRTKHGRKQDEAAWRNAEVDTIYRLRDAGVRVPEPLNFVDGVLLMELVKDAEGHPAPRLGDRSYGAAEATEIYRTLIQETVRMLCAGVIHGDLSEFNVLMGVSGPVVIDFPQAVDPAHNRNARKLLLRDVENLHRFLERFSPGSPRRAHGEEMWALYESNRLSPDTELRGNYRPPEGSANTEEVLALIDDAALDARRRRAPRDEDAFDEASEEAPEEAPVAPKPLRKVVTFAPEAKPGKRAGERSDAGAGARPKRARSRTAGKRGAARAPSEKTAAAPKKKRSRRKPKSEAGGEGTGDASRNAASPRSQSQSQSRAQSQAPADADAAKAPKKRRRRGRTGARKKTEPTETRGEGSTKPPARPAKPGGAARTGGGAGGGASGTDRPPRRRRRPRSERDR